VFRKTLRDSRRALLIAVAFIVVFILIGAAAVASAFGTVETRQEMVGLATTLPGVFQSLLGPPIGIESLGGLIEWRYYSVIFLMLPLWSILALSSTLAGEADRGSLDLVVTSGLARGRVALEKLVGHVVVVAIAMVALGILLWVSGIVFATLPGDDIPPRAAAGYALFAGLMVLAPGAIAFAAAPFLGRGASAGLAVLVLVGGYLINAFRGSVELFDALRPVTWFAWTEQHIPLAGREDWPSVIPMVVLILGLYVVGIVAFVRRDIGRTIRVPAPHLPRALVGLRGPFDRTFGERLPIALAWGLGLGAYVLLISTSAHELGDMIRSVPAIQQIMAYLYPDIDYTSVGGVLQLVFLDFGLVIFGLAAATLVGGWASEETSGRLEVVLSAPMTRVGWLVRSALGTFLAIVVASSLVSLAAAIGAQSQGSDPGIPARGAFVLALYGLAWAGVGIAVAGWARASLAAPTIAALTIGTFLLTLFATALKWPDWIADRALPAHYGKPLVGEWDPVGVVASLVLAFGGVAVGAWGFSRRDLRG